jgi:ribonuclease HI
LEVVSIHGSFSWKRVHALELLGTQVDESGSSSSALQYRLGKADAFAWASRSWLFVRSSFHAKITSWTESVQAVAVFGTSHLHWTKELLRRARSWELSWMRRLLRFRRRPDEGAQLFFSRTSRYITKLFADIGKPMIHQRMLGSTFSLFFKRCDLLRSIQEARATTWKAIQASIPYKKRKAAKTLQVSTGYRVHFGDLLKCAWGEQWESTLSKTTYSKTARDTFVRGICGIWKFPVSSKREKDGPPPAIQPTPKDRIAYNFTDPSTLDLLTLPPLHINDRRWDQSAQQIEFITDSQVLAQIMNGEALYDSPSNYDLVCSSVDALEDVLRQGWMTRYIVMPMVRWRPRSWNTLADLLAGHALESKVSLICRSSDFDAQLRNPGLFLQVHTDGACNTTTLEGSTGMSWTVYSRTASGNVIRKVILIACTYSRKTSAFQAETIALQETLRNVRLLRA